MPLYGGGGGGGADSGAKRLVRYYVKPNPNELFCVALKVRASRHFFD